MCAVASGASSSDKPGEDFPTASKDDATSHHSHSGAQTEGYDLREGRATWARRLVIGYQEYLSGLKMGPTCRFEPTCSNYALTAFSRHGVVKGLILTLGRLARCGPWHPGGWDPVPPRRRSRR